jgi:HAD superfamily hydrolase (TIGR01509 family)
LLDSSPLRPGVEELITLLSNESIPLAIASSSPLQWIKRHLEHRGLLKCFSCIATADDVKVVKPFPDIYINLLSKLNRLPAEVVTFEDSQNGIKAAKSSNLFCIAVPNEITKHTDLSEADMIISSVLSISLAELKVLV